MNYFFSLFFGTFLLEDLALATSLALITQHKISLLTGFSACFLGISIGDILLYLLGFIGARFGVEKHFRFFKNEPYLSLTRMRKSSAMSTAIVLSRMIPGARLPTYVGAGFLRFPFWRFVYLTFASVFVWVLVALSAGKSLQYLLMDHWILILLSFLFILKISKSLIPKLLDPWERSALLYSWRQYLHFEFWPPMFFYLPIVPIYIYLSIKYRSFYLPFYANPNLVHGGLIGESKWEFLKHLDRNEKSTLTALKISKDLDFFSSKKILDENNFSYPFIIKPDIGQRGFGVRILHNDFDLTEYLLLSNFDRIVQRLSLLPLEAGIFYIRRPHEEFGKIFSLTDKRFPYIIGDGKSSLGSLILQDKRARIIASVYFQRLKERLDAVPDINTVVPLAECGNHCQGAIFLNGRELISDALSMEIDRIAKQIPDFYFGRIDVRYKSAEDLKLGRDFEIVELNGAGAEATHIWDARTSLREAYLVLYKQWSYLFELGAFQRSIRGDSLQLHLYAFFKEVIRVSLRKTALSISS